MEMLKISLAVLFHPADTFRYLKKDRSKFSYTPVFTLMLLMLLVQIASIYLTHFPLAKIQPRDANIVLESMKSLLPVITWVIASYAITTIMDGEYLLRENLIATAYSLIPYIVFTIPLTLSSHFLDNAYLSLFNGIQRIILAWVLMLFFISLKVMNEYTIKKTILIYILGALTMLLIWATLSLFFAISSQFFNFIEEVMIEIKMKFLI